MYREAAVKKEEYQVLEELGRGRFGTVFRCFHRTSNKFYAAKLIEKRRLLNEDRRCIEMEAKAMSFLSPHPNILQIMDAFEDADSCSIVLELCQPHTLLDRIAAQGPLTEPHAASLLKQLSETLPFLPKAARDSRTGTSSRKTSCSMKGTSLSSQTSGPPSGWVRGVA